MIDIESELWERLRFLDIDQKRRVLDFVKAIEVENPSQEVKIVMTLDPWQWSFIVKTANGVNTGRSGYSDDGIDMYIAVVEYFRSQRGMLIGRPMAARIVLEIGSVLPLPQERPMVVKGRIIATGLPGATEVSSTEIREVVLPFVERILRIIAFQVKHDPALSKESFVEATILLRGEIANIKGVAERLQESTGIKVIHG